MTNTEKTLIHQKMKPENAKKLVEILEEFWAHGNTNLDHYRKRLKGVTSRTNLIEQAEELYCQEFTDYDLIFNTPRLKNDPLWPVLLQMVEDIHHTGKCPFCTNRMVPFDGRQICRPCSRVFSIRRRGYVAPVDPESVFIEAANG